MSYGPKVLLFCQVLTIISPTCNIVTEQISEKRVYFPYLVKCKVFYVLNLSPRIQHEKGSGNIIHIFLMLALAGCDQPHVPAFYSHGTRHRYTLHTRLVGTQLQYGRLEWRKVLPPVGNLTLTRH